MHGVNVMLWFYLQTVTMNGSGLWRGSQTCSVEKFERVSPKAITSMLHIALSKFIGAVQRIKYTFHWP